MKIWRPILTIFLAGCATILLALQLQTPQQTEAMQLSGAAAAQFLVNENILSPEAVSQMTAPDGRNFDVPQPVTLTTGTANDEFGFSVALDGNTAVIGAPLARPNGTASTGAVYVYINDGTAWQLEQELLASDGLNSDLFGTSVAIDGDTVAIGALAEIGFANFQGKAYVFTRSAGVWTEEEIIIAADGQEDDFFGYDIDIEGDTLAIGAPLAPIGMNSSQGGVYVYTRSSTSWSLEQKFSSSDGAANDWFGISVSLSGEQLLVGANQAQIGMNGQQGAAYLFERSGTTWNEVTKMTAGDGAAGDQFGNSVALDGETAVIGAYFAQIGGNAQQGAAYIFEQDPSPSTTWSETLKLFNTNGRADDFFGIRVDIDADTVLVGASQSGNRTFDDQGLAQIFIRVNGSWQFHQTLSPYDVSGEYKFGQSVAISGDFAVMGAPYPNSGASGRVYIAQRGSVPWFDDPFVTPADGMSGDNFGLAVAVEGDTAVIGANNAYIASTGNFNQGAVYIYERINGVWTEGQKLIASDGQDGDQFGNAVALDGDTLLIGAWQASYGGIFGRGAAYVFTRSNGVWSEQDKLENPTPTQDDYFGRAMALEGNTAVVGAPGKDVAANVDQGVAFTFTRSGNLWSFEQQINHPDPESFNSFGRAVAIEGNTLLISASGASVGMNANQGKAYVFNRTTSWAYDETLTAFDGRDVDFFGNAVDIDGNTIAVAAWSDGINDEGSVYIFTEVGNSWLLQQKLIASDRAFEEFFGSSVALDGDTILVGAIGSNLNGKADQGAAYVFGRVNSNWTQQQKLLAPDGEEMDSFGYVALDGDTALVGAPFANPSSNGDQGKAYFFERQKLTQQIVNFTLPPTIEFPKVGQSFALPIYATSGLTIAYSSETESVCALIEFTVELLNSGTCTITARQSGSPAYLAAEPQTLTFTIEAARLFLPIIAH